jgi:UDP-N-acetyl-D-mannosaminuronic acid transferase (WecB/TagA/CpsF family)
MEEFVLDYKLLSLERNPHYERLKQINKEVKKFIKDKQLIITGGMAIDIALRMKGEHIYNLNSADTALPD